VSPSRSRGTSNSRPPLSHCRICVQAHTARQLNAADPPTHHNTRHTRHTTTHTTHDRTTECRVGSKYRNRCMRSPSDWASCETNSTTSPCTYAFVCVTSQFCVHAARHDTRHTRHTRHTAHMQRAERSVRQSSCSGGISRSCGGRPSGSPSPCPSPPAALPIHYCQLILKYNKE
jgi:hypothetical protein